MQTTTKTALRAILQSDPTIAAASRAAVLAILDGKQADTAPASPPAPHILRRAEVARRLSVGIRTCDLWAKQGILEKVKLPGRKRAAGFREADVLALINRAA